jgi:hypothetical protein
MGEFGNGLASFGRTTTTLKSVVLICCAMCICISGLVALVAKPTQVHLDKTSKKTMNSQLIGGIMISCACLVAMCALLQMYLVQKSRGYAQFSGAVTGIDMATSMFRS